MWKADVVQTIIAIDGPAGSGKSTLARGLAVALDLPYVNTGLMYRALAARALRRGVDPDDDGALLELLATFRFALDAGASPVALAIDGSPPGPELTSVAVEGVVSRVARHPGVRAAMRDAQRLLGAGGGVLEGRDIGTVVFPEAGVKFFLVAHEDARVARREAERDGATDVARLSDRDARDAKVNPFVPAPDAVVLDTTELSREETLARALAEVRRRTGGS